MYESLNLFKRWWTIPSHYQLGTINGPNTLKTQNNQQHAKIFNQSWMSTCHIQTNPNIFCSLFVSFARQKATYKLDHKMEYQIEHSNWFKRRMSILSEYQLRTNNDIHNKLMIRNNQHLCKYSLLNHDEYIQINPNNFFLFVSFIRQKATHKLDHKMEHQIEGSNLFKRKLTISSQYQLQTKNDIHNMLIIWNNQHPCKNILSILDEYLVHPNQAQ